MRDKFLAFWGKHCELDRSHIGWLQHFAVPLKAKRGQLLFELDEPQRDHALYFVCSGLMAMAWWDEEGNRRLERFLLPGDSALSSLNLYTDTPKRCGLLALRPSTLLRIPAEPLREYKESCREAETLCAVLEYNKLRQFRQKAKLTMIKESESLYRAFLADDYMKPFARITSQPEQADYLNISVRTISRIIQGL